ncbi:hypothetical protein HDF15_005268 [Granulicella mallensis]|uniref:DDE domain-containing protein n=1 Tax=Granulicella mallensis TaxID=940614 RepID=A0A7W7ZW19_9BACT|nr:hypothetical protein [Granulicella mallensis]
MRFPPQSVDTKHRTYKYLNNIIEADHGALKRVICPTRGFQTMKAADVTIKGFEVMRMILVGIASHVSCTSKTRWFIMHYIFRVSRLHPYFKYAICIRILRSSSMS